jgi:hypothetical protein
VAAKFGAAPLAEPQVLEQGGGPVDRAAKFVGQSGRTFSE